MTGQLANPSRMPQGFLLCEAGETLWAIERAQVLSIQLAEVVAEEALDHDEPALIGSVLSQQGKIPVFSLERLLDQDDPEIAQVNASSFPPAKARDQILILRHGKSAVGYRVRRVLPLPQGAEVAVYPVPAILQTEPQLPYRGFLLIPETNLDPNSNGQQPEEEDLDFSRLTIPWLDPSFLLSDTFGGRESIPSEPFAPRLLKSTFEDLPQRSLEAGGRQIVLFSVPALQRTSPPLQLGLSVSQVLEILPQRPYVPLPLTENHWAGLILWRDRPVPVLSLATRLDLPLAAWSSPPRLLICQPSPTEDLFGFLVNPDVRTYRLPLPWKPSAAELPIDSSCIRGVFTQSPAPSLMAVLNLSRLVRAVPRRSHLSLTAAQETHSSWETPS
ncbi:Hypothetical protein PBC10988_29260 [Planctomycetales bacterium 10988]|nr:Hypothetical protein PBC10988_29260 [Planctomycetales bacterium 10988]